jgi:hypothetical protein
VNVHCEPGDDYWPDTYVPVTALFDVRRDGNHRRLLGRVSPFMGKLAPVHWGAVQTLARLGLESLGRVEGRALVVGLTESSLIMAWGLAAALGNCADLTFTTREHRSFRSCRRFKEPHSHGPFHMIALDEARSYRHVVIMEDEITSGTTLMNLIVALAGVSQRFTVLALRDYREAVHRESWRKGFEGAALDVKVVELAGRKIRVNALQAGEADNGATRLNPFGRSPSHFRKAFVELSANWDRYRPGTIYAVGECLDVPLAFLTTLPLKDRPRLRHVTRSPWLVDGGAIRSRVDISGGRQTAAHYAYNWVKPDPARTVVVVESANRVVGDGMTAFLKSRGCDVTQVEVLTGD